MIAEKREDGRVQTEATIKIWVDGERYVKTAEGNGPVNALDTALRAAITETYPHLADIKLVNYKVRILDEAKATGAVTRVLLDASDGTDTWGAIGVSENVIEASWEALVDSLEAGFLPGACTTSAAPRGARPPRDRRRRSRSPGPCWARRRSARSLEVLRSGQLSLGPRAAARSRRRSRRASARATPARCRPARRRCTSRCARSASGRATRSSRRRSRSSRRPTRSSTSARGRCSPTSTR